MKEKTLLKEFIQYVALNICGMIGLSCYILADTFFVSRGLGANGLVALNLAIPIYSFVHGSGLMLGMGGGTKYSIYMGQGKFKTKLSMIAMLAGSLSNIVLDYVFIFPLHMGIFGAVLATGFAPVISLGVLSRHWITKNNQFHFEKTRSSLRLIGNIGVATYGVIAKLSLVVTSVYTGIAQGIQPFLLQVLIL